MESLYRKYRPQTFADMVGQQHIVSTLRNALTEGRVAHAYLFSGPRGTGKTTTARVLAKALLCTGGHAGEVAVDPDGTCEECLAIADGTHPDVYELDAASRTGVDSVREEIINRVAFAPTRGRYKVYIIDEVHMLSVAAFNALLKTLEEPPSHVIFVLCTTDPQKVPETILSRCQRLEFHRISIDDIEQRLTYVCQQEGFEADQQAIALVAKHSRGGLRDALSMLEQLSVFGDGAVRLDDAQSVLGEVSSDTLAHMVERIADRDVAGCFAQVADLAERGVDIAQYTRDLTSYVRDLYVASVTRGADGVLAGGTDPKAALAAAERVGGPDRLARMLDLLGQLEANLRTSLDQRLSLEVTLTRIARPKSDLTLESLAERVAELERQVAAGGVVAPGSAAGFGGASPMPQAQAPTSYPAASRPAQPTAAGSASYPAGQPTHAAAPTQGRPAQPSFAGTPARAATPAAAMTPPTPPAPQRPVQAAAPATAAPCPPQAAPVGASVLDRATSQRLWGQLVDQVMTASPSVGALMRTAEGVLTSQNTLTIINHGSSFAEQMLGRASSREIIERVAAMVYGHPVHMEVRGMSSVAAAPAAPVSRPAAASSAPAARPAPAAPSAPVVPAASAAPFAAAAPTVQAAPAAPVVPAAPAAQAAPVAQAASRPAQAPAAPEQAPAYEAVPDEVYDSYVPDDVDEFVNDRDDVSAQGSGKGGAPAQSAGRGDAPAQGVTPSQSGSPAGGGAAGRPDAQPEEPADGVDSDAMDLAQLLSAGFGGYVKVKEEPGADA